MYSATVEKYCDKRVFGQHVSATFVFNLPLARMKTSKCFVYTCVGSLRQNKRRVYLCLSISP